MNQNTDNNIHDKFLKKLIAMQPEEKVPDDFTQRVMAGLPKFSPVAVKADKKPDLRLLAVIVAASAAVIFVLFSFDFNSIFKAINAVSGNDPAKYFNLLASISTSFGNAFSGIRISSVSIAALVSLAMLLMADKLLSKWFTGHAGGA